MNLIDLYQKDTYPINEFCDEKTKFVYLFYNETTKLCKIGITSDAKVRLRQLINSSGMLIKPLIVIELEPNYDEPAKYIEKWLHDYYSDKRKVGEWFNLTLRDAVKIRRFFWDIEGYCIDDYFKNNKLN